MDAHTQKRYDDLKAFCTVLYAPLEKLEKDGRMLRKSKSMSIEARKAGNDLYVDEKKHDSHIHKDILSQYSKSIAFAPKGTEELVLGYSNRSILLMHLHHYKESLVDIDRALKLPEDDVFKTKLQARKEKCLKLINEKNLKETSKVSNFCNNKEPGNFASKLMNFEPSTTLPCASNCIGFAYNDNFGRHLVATRDIEPEEILIVEESHVCYKKKCLLYIVRSHCLQIAGNDIPCDDCVFTIYCIEACKDQGLKEYHDIEIPNA